MNHPNYFISCDWGTTNFRLKVVETTALKVMAEHVTDRGVKSLYQAFRKTGGRDQTVFFSNHLKKQLAHFSEDFQSCPVVISGMATADIGMYEMPYGTLPFGASMEGLKTHRTELYNGIEAVFISGIRSEEDVMRGEETQALGLREELLDHGDGILILPGTHSKHLTFTDGSYTDFTTYLTGELFELLTRQSLLANSVTPGPFSGANVASFRAGVVAATKERISSRLFSIRARSLLRHTPPERNFYYLSGLLIGDELSCLTNGASTVFLAAPSATAALYRTAIETLGSSIKPIFIAADHQERALLVGQRKILLSHGR